MKMARDMEEVYIIDAARSATGKFLGALSHFTAPKLAAEVMKGLVSRSNIDHGSIDEIIVGNVLSAGLGQNPAKQVAVYSGMPYTIPAFSVNKVCASGMKAVALGAEAISSGNDSIAVAGGMESMSNAPHTIKGLRKFKKIGNMSLKELDSSISEAKADSNSIEVIDEMVNGGLWDCYANLHMGSLAEKIKEKYDISREEQDMFAFDSHRKAAAADDSGKFAKEIIPITLSDGKNFKADEGIRRDTSMEKLASLKPAFHDKGTVTAGNASQLSDGASFILLASGSKVKELGLKPIAKIESYASSGIDPDWYGIAPVSAMNKALKNAGYSLEDMDLIEINEAFCVQTLGVAKELGIDLRKLNVNGGATALGHPIGASGARILTTLAFALVDRKKDLGIASLCHGGGGAMAMVIRRIG